jgi:hypothetical protein
MHLTPSRCFVLALALCSIGAKDCGTSGTAPVMLPDAALYCLTDPPVGCAAYCSAPQTITFLPACSGPSAGPAELDFELKLRAKMMEFISQGLEVCPQATPGKFMTPCIVDVWTTEWPNQDHNVCTPAPVGCI